MLVEGVYDSCEEMFDAGVHDAMRCAEFVCEVE